MEEWDLARSSGRCDRCGSALTEGQAYYGLLVESEDGFERKDLCPSCWDAGPVAHFCFWKSRVPVREKAESKNLLVDNAVLVNFFERLDQQTDPMRLRFRFVLALILMRKKLLRYEQTIRNDETEFWQMRLVATNALHQVENPRMDDEQITEVSRQLGVILRGETPSDPVDLLDEEAPDGRPQAEARVSDESVADGQDRADSVQEEPSGE